MKDFNPKDLEFNIDDLDMENPLFKKKLEEVMLKKVIQKWENSFTEDEMHEIIKETVMEKTLHELKEKGLLVSEERDGKEWFKIHPDISKAIDITDEKERLAAIEAHAKKYTS